MNKRTPTLAILAVGLLAIGAFATTAAAKPGDGSASDDPDRSGPRHDRHDDRVNRSAERQDRHERMRDAHDAWQACKRENSTENVSMRQRCGDEKAFFLNSTHARREAHAHLGAIAALERQIGRLEVRELRLEEKLASGNFTGNQTAESIQERIERIEAAQARLAEKLEQLKERLDALQDKWASARERVKESRHGDDGEDEEDEDDSLSSSSSSSAAA